MPIDPQRIRDAQSLLARHFGPTRIVRAASLSSPGHDVFLKIETRTADRIVQGPRRDRRVIGRRAGRPSGRPERDTIGAESVVLVTGGNISPSVRRQTQM
jgi:hypothetical protein